MKEKYFISVTEHHLINRPERPCEVELTYSGGHHDLYLYLSQNSINLKVDIEGFTPVKVMVATTVYSFKNSL